MLLSLTHITFQHIPLSTGAQILNIPEMRCLVWASEIRVSLHRASASTLLQPCDDASDTAFIVNNGVATHPGVTPLISMRAASLPSITSVIVALTLSLGVDGS